MPEVKTVFAETTFNICGTFDPIRGWDPCPDSYDYGYHNCGYIENGDDAGIVHITTWANLTGTTDTVGTWKLFTSDGSGRIQDLSSTGALPLTYDYATDNESFARQPVGLFGIEPAQTSVAAGQQVDFVVRIDFTGPEVPKVFLGFTTCA